MICCPSQNDVLVMKSSYLSIAPTTWLSLRMARGAWPLELDIARFRHPVDEALFPISQSTESFSVRQ
ncbi:hypothetical protein D0864_04168 [Hortaea werneckii]|uniref:Uncharacterized protein n=1 Tax=Hortaea werneckii TaxID=91943 RepID=A0A3M7GD27_HORWE|nr:hypothetical protein D0864_04168 [Hortaea werneckii]